MPVFPAPTGLAQRLMAFGRMPQLLAQDPAAPM
jgi:hypothetical protein